MSRRFATTTLAALLVTALLFLCLGDLVEAAAPAMDGVGCALCSESTGCGTVVAKVAVLPVTVVVTRVTLAPPATISAPAESLAPGAPHARQVVPRAPRSPPVV
jgi:hypothetical protein